MTDEECSSKKYCHKTDEITESGTLLSMKKINEAITSIKQECTGETSELREDFFETGKNKWEPQKLRKDVEKEKPNCNPHKNKEC